MITTEEIAVKVRELLLKSDVRTAISGVIAYQRCDYSKEDVIIVPHTITGGVNIERYGQININIHVPDIPQNTGNGKCVYHVNFARLIQLRGMAIKALQNHYELGQGYNWTIGLINPPIKEPEQNEHFVSFALELTIRERK